MDLFLTCCVAGTTEALAKPSFVMENCGRAGSDDLLYVHLCANEATPEAWGFDLDELLELWHRRCKIWPKGSSSCAGAGGSGSGTGGSGTGTGTGVSSSAGGFGS